MARAKLFMEQLQRAIKNFSVKCWSAWVDQNNTAVFGTLSSSDWLTFIADWIPFQWEQGGTGDRGADGAGLLGRRYDEAKGELDCNVTWLQRLNSFKEMAYSQDW